METIWNLRGNRWPFGGVFRSVRGRSSSPPFRHSVPAEVKLAEEVQELEPVLPLEQGIIHTRIAASRDGRREIGRTAKEAVG
jgi:hypothetical protein